MLQCKATAFRGESGVALDEAVDGFLLQIDQQAFGLGCFRPCAAERPSRSPRSVDEIGYLSIGNSYRCGITPSSGMPSTPLKPGGANNRETSQEKEAPVPVG